MYYLLKLTELILQNIPRKAGYFVFEAFALMAFAFSNKRKETLRKNIGNVLGKEDVPDSLLKKIYKNYARYYFDLFTPKEKLFNSMKDVSLLDPPIEAIGKLLSERGVIMVSMHFGNWDFGGAYISKKLPGKINVVVEKLSPPLYRWFTETRTGMGMKVIEASDVKAMLRALKNKEVLILLGDRDLDRNGFKFDFFGKKASIPAGPATLACAAGSPVFVGAFGRDPGNPLYFSPNVELDPIEPSSGKRNKESVEETAKKIIIKMERLISSDPSQWCMLQEVWVEE